MEEPALTTQLGEYNVFALQVFLKLIGSSLLNSILVLIYESSLYKSEIAFVDK